MDHKPTIVIHGGMHKTGTSALQHLLASERDELLNHGFLFPDCESPHHNFVVNTRHPDWTPEPLLSQLNLDRKMRSVVLPSAEVVSILSDAKVDRLCDHLGESEILFVFAFRHWCEYLPTRWAQNCKRRDSQSFREYFDNLRHRDRSHIDAKFDAVLSGIRSRSNVQVKAVSYSNATHFRSAPLSEIMSAMDMTSELVDQLVAREQRVNTRPDWIAVEKLRLLNGTLSNHLKLIQNDLFEAIPPFFQREFLHGLGHQRTLSPMLA